MSKVQPSSQGAVWISIIVTARNRNGSVALTAVSQPKLRNLFFSQSKDRIVLPVTTRSPADVYTALCVSYGLTQCRPVSSAPGEMI